MELSPTSTRDLALLLLAIETASKSATDAHGHPAGRICEKLRISVTRFAGADGFASLLRRALSLARADIPSIQTLAVGPDGHSKRPDVLVADATADGPEAAVALAAHLLGLLVTFVGEPITLRLVRDAWPDAVWDKTVNNRGDA